MSTLTSSPSAAITPAPSLPKTHDVSLDVLRLVATFMVILIHVSAAGFSQKVEHWWSVNAYESLSRASVPVFFMITGALLLPRTHSISDTLRCVWRMAFSGHLVFGVPGVQQIQSHRLVAAGLIRRATLPG